MDGTGNQRQRALELRGSQEMESPLLEGHHTRMASVRLPHKEVIGVSV